MKQQKPVIWIHLRPTGKDKHHEQPNMEKKSGSDAGRPLSDPGPLRDPETKGSITGIVTGALGGAATAGVLTGEDCVLHTVLSKGRMETRGISQHITVYGSPKLLQHYMMPTTAQPCHAAHACKARVW
jgi:hypothetical protein